MACGCGGVVKGQTPTTTAPLTFLGISKQASRQQIKQNRPLSIHSPTTIAPLTFLAMSTAISMPPAMPSHIVAERITPALEHEYESARGAWRGWAWDGSVSRPEWCTGSSLLAALQACVCAPSRASPSPAHPACTLFPNTLHTQGSEGAHPRG